MRETFARIVLMLAFLSFPLSSLACDITDRVAISNGENVLGKVITIDDVVTVSNATFLNDRCLSSTMETTCYVSQETDSELTANMVPSIKVLPYEVGWKTTNL